MKSSKVLGAIAQRLKICLVRCNGDRPSSVSEKMDKEDIPAPETTFEKIDFQFRLNSEECEILDRLLHDLSLLTEEIETII